MKKKLLFTLLWRILTLFLLSSCRTEGSYFQQEQQKDMRFSVFVPKKEGETINYANGFAFLMKRYDSLHKTNLSGINNKPVIGTHTASTRNASILRNGKAYVEFNIRSQTITEENGDKWVVFPKVENGVVTGLVVGILSEKESYVKYQTIGAEHEFYKANILLFQQGVSRYLSKMPRVNALALVDKGAALQANICGQTSDSACEIEEVAITVPRNSGGSSGYIGGGYGGGGREEMSGDCPKYDRCLNEGEGGGWSGGSGESEVSADQWAEEHIDDKDLKDNKCANDVYQKLKSKPGLFNNLLGKFEGNSILNLNFKIDNLGTTDSYSSSIGQTVFKYPHATITLNKEMMGSDDMLIASVIIHEILHAKILHDLVKAGYGWKYQNLQNIPRSSLPTILDEYGKVKFNLNKGDIAEHNYMADWYVNQVANALATYDNYNSSSEFYNKMAWQPLSQARAWDKLDENFRKSVSTTYYNQRKVQPCGK